MANFIVRAFQRRKLRKLPCVNKRVYTSFDDAKTVAFVFNSQTPRIDEAIKIFEKAMKEMNISYRGLGISFTKDETTNPKLDHDPYVVQILSKETNWLDIPIIEQAEEFYNGDYDILFDFSLDTSFTIKYSLKRCRCNMIVGYSPDMQNMYDIFIGDGGRERSIVERIEYTIGYISTIKSK